MVIKININIRGNSRDTRYELCVLRVKIDSHYRRVGNTSRSVTKIVYIILYFSQYSYDVWADNTINTINNNNNHTTFAANMTPTEYTGELNANENKI